MSQAQLVNLSAAAPGAAANPEAAVPQGTPAPAAAAPVPSGAFVPLLLCALTLLVWFVAQSVLLLGEREALQAAYASQQQTVDNAGKLRGSLDALAADTQRMADAGNSNAALLVAELRKRGITINVQAGGAAAAPTAPDVTSPR